MMNRIGPLCAWLAIALAWGAGPALAQQFERSVLLATTTSLQDSGLLAVLLPVFTEQSGIRVQAVAVGTGAALRMGAEGNADLLLTHAPGAEAILVSDGAIAERVEIMENYFVLAGPAADPGGVSRSPTASQALARIHAQQLPFVSRADDSGTHKREIALFRDAGIDPDARWPGLTRTGSAMGISLEIAGQRQAYILSDIATFLAFQDRVGLVSLSHEEPGLRNVYSVLRVDPIRFPRVRAAEAKALADFLQSESARAIMREFGAKKFGRALFQPVAAPAAATTS
jgi:tungstate transport system substrate-binding protein